ncbi:hypothetical protein SAMN06265795_12264 [Noviherbaspirillum humi]|uniref:Uncharacterized protein n=1 Tax=Noviherbaspirillum humi TaxID=1688639 RepID=A0A239LIA4_9BURK|nr:hypothetical protein [Noviherbaspirillum humi]SNT29284.1 hypothetical protein SAMN06265795_12264 [Noviherbaspirillum humi]
MDQEERFTEDMHRQFREAVLKRLREGDERMGAMSAQIKENTDLTKEMKEDFADIKKSHEEQGKGIKEMLEILSVSKAGGRFLNFVGTVVVKAAAVWAAITGIMHLINGRNGT